MKINKNQLLRSQRQLLDAGFLKSRRSWVICAPTGAGKTRMGEWALLQAASRGHRGVYLAPLKAIVEEKAADWAQRYPQHKIGLYTGETTRQKSRRHPVDETFLLMTSEKLSTYLSNWKRHLAWLAEIDVVVLDEFHLLGDPSRGPTVETLIGRMQRINPFVRFIGLSATVSNSAQLASWLQAEEFITLWRPVPLTHRIVRFGKVADKPNLLKREVSATTEQNGQVLVFVNSRRRSEHLAANLAEAGFRSAFYHAGLGMVDRTARQSAMYERGIDVLVSTSSLEMGVNFPARKVIVYDSYVFNGDGFGALPVGRYIQFAGRAGRPGLDDTGESVLFLPKWHGDAEAYQHGITEPITSGLGKVRIIQKEIITEVASRLSISTEHLAVNFSNRSFHQATEGYSDLSVHVDRLVDAGLLARRCEAERYLIETPLGRIASQMDVSPDTIQIFDRFYQNVPNPCLFDCILSACLCPELTPKLPFSFEQMDDIGDILTATPSHLMDATPSATAALSPSNLPTKTLLSAIKSAVVLIHHTAGEPLDVLSEKYDCYPMDIAILKRNTDWMLATAMRVFAFHWRRQHLKEIGDDNEKSRPLCIHEKRIRQLVPMIKYGLPADACSLVSVKGIGPKRAISLHKHGFSSLQALADASVRNISTVLKIRPELCTKFKKDANLIIAEQRLTLPFDQPDEPSPIPPHNAIADWPLGVDPYRLRRALDLKIIHRSDECIRVEGGVEPHTIHIQFSANGNRKYRCDCIDATKGNLCKHVMRTRLECGDGQELITALRVFSQKKQQPLRYALSELWSRGSALYDRYEERIGDYDGRRFLQREAANYRWNR